MATLEQLAEAIRRADAAGNAEDVKALGTAYRQMQASAGPSVTKLTGTVAPQGSTGERSTNIEDARSAQDKYDFALKDVRRKYYPWADDAKWAEITQRQGMQPYDARELGNAGLTFGLADETRGLSGGLGNLLSGQDFGQGFKDFQGLETARMNLGREQQGPLGTAAEMAGAVFAGGPSALRTMVGAKTLPKMIEGGKNAALQGGLYGFNATDGGLKDRAAGALVGATVGGATGAAVPAVVGSMAKRATAGAQRKATDAAIRNAPGAAELKDASRSLFQAVDASGVTVNTPRFSQFVEGLARKAKADRISPELDPKAYSAFKELIGALDDVQQSGGALTVGDMHTLRQIAQKAATSSEGRDAMFAQRIVDGLDDFVVSPGATVMPPNTTGSTAAGSELLKAISTWGRARRVGLIEDAFTKAKNQASGFENGLRVEFRKLLQNDRTRSLFSDTERAAIEAVVRGTTAANLTKLLGKFGFAPNNMLGGTIGGLFGGSLAAGGNPLGGIALAGAGTLARKASEKMTERAADRAARVVATPNIPTVGQTQLPGIEQFLQQAIRAAQPLLAK